MSARVLVVDDILPNVKLLEAKLSSAYFEVITALNGIDALELAEKQGPDIILLDVMMPGMDGFEVCEKLKENPKTAHIPVVMVTALTDATDRVRGLEAGADDFLSKPVNDTALMARVKSLVRLKMTIDEWRIRETTANQFGVFDGQATQQAEPAGAAKILVVEDKTFESDKFLETLKRDEDAVYPAVSGDQALSICQEHDFDLITVSLNMELEDGLRLVSLFRSNERTRSVPILMVGLEEDLPRIAQGLELGAHDYILRPVDRNELLARARTQIRRKRYQERLRNNYEQSLNMALTDTLTGLFNRRYLNVHFGKIISNIENTRKPIGLLMMDIDHFKQFNDTYGHNVGDEVLKTFADRVKEKLRSFDLVARQGGEEFVAVLPDIKPKVAMRVAERLRKAICDEPIVCSAPEGTVNVSVSIGGTIIEDPAVNVDDALKRADDCLYQAKDAGRNCVIFEGYGKVTPELYMSEEELAEYNQGGGADKRESKLSELGGGQDTSPKPMDNPEVQVAPTQQPSQQGHVSPMPDVPPVAVPPVVPAPKKDDDILSGAYDTPGTPVRPAPSQPVEPPPPAPQQQGQENVLESTKEKSSLELEDGEPSKQDSKFF